MSIVAKVAMALFLSFAAFDLAEFWGGQMLGFHNDIWEAFELGDSDARPGTPSVLFGAGLHAAALAGLVVAFFAIWQTLDGGTHQDFRLLAARLRWIGLGLVIFWLADFLMWLVMPFLLSIQDAASGPVDAWLWVPINLEIVFLILAVALLAIARTLERAWEAEDEVRHFL